MDQIYEKHNKKKDKAKKNFDLNGGLSAKHVRLQEALLERKKKK